MNIPETFSEELILAIVEGGVVYLEGATTEEDLPGWDDFIRVMDRAAKRDYSAIDNQDPVLLRTINDVLIEGVNKFKIKLDAADQEDIRKAEEVWTLLRKTAPGFDTFEFSELHLTLFGGGRVDLERNFLKDQVFLQCRGRSNWRIYGGNDETTLLKSFELEPGSLLFISSKYHSSVEHKGSSAGVLYTLRSEDAELQSRGNH